MDQESLKDSVNRIRVKAAMLHDRYVTEREQQRSARRRIAELEDETETLRRRISQLEVEIETLKMASVLTPDHRDVEATRSRLSGLVREIDKCINLLSH